LYTINDRIRATVRLCAPAYQKRPLFYEENIKPPFSNKQNRIAEYEMRIRILVHKDSQYGPSRSYIVENIFIYIHKYFMWLYFHDKFNKHSVRITAPKKSEIF
jgi:hypothetical protein